MAYTIDPPPIKSPIDSFVWKDWFKSLQLFLTGPSGGGSGIAWSTIDKSGSNLTDLATRNHNDLQTIQGGSSSQYYHLTSAQYTVYGLHNSLTDLQGGTSGQYYHLTSNEYTGATQSNIDAAKLTGNTWAAPEDIGTTTPAVGNFTTFKAGNISGGNYTEIESDGTLEFLGDATVWDDLRVTPGSFDRPGISDPSIVAVTPGGSGTTTYLYEFDIGDIASFTVQLPHGYKQGTNISVHIHWTPGTRGNEESGNTVGWKVDYTWANINGTFGAMSTADLSDACNGVDWEHNMTPAVSITGSGQNISSMLICNVKRTDTGTDDTWVTNTTTNLPLLLEIDFHYEIDTVGSRTVSTK